MDVYGCRGRTGQVYIPDPLNMTTVFSSGTLSELNGASKNLDYRYSKPSRRTYSCCHTEMCQS